MLKHILLTLGVGVGATVAAPAQDTPSFAFGKPGTAPRVAAGSLATAAAAHPRRSLPGKVPMPPSPTSRRTIIEDLESRPGYNLFVQSAERAGLVQRLQSVGPYTVFVPSDAAFGALPGGRLDEFWKPANRAALHAMLASHLVAGDVKASALTDGLTLHTLAGTKLLVHRQGNRIELEDPAGQRAALSATDLPAVNGTIHTLDAVLAQP